MTKIAFLYLILATPVAIAEERRPGVPVFACEFDQAWDVNFDRSPDGWKRQTGDGYPGYIRAAMEDDGAAVAGQCLNIHLNGGNAALQSPEIPVSHLYSYRLDARVKSSGVISDSASITIEFLDKAGAVVQRNVAHVERDAIDWTNATIGPVALASSDVARAVIRIETHAGEKPDLKGTFSFDDVRLVRLPRVDVRTNDAINIYSSPDDVVVTCDISGIDERHPMIHFELRDYSGARLNESDEPIRFAGEIISMDPTVESGQLGVASRLPDGFSGSVRWKAPIPDFGFYRIHVRIEGSSQILEERDIAVAIINENLPRAKHGEFGWSLASAEKPFSMDVLTRLLPKTGVHWVKVPVWYHEGDDAYGDRVLRFTEHLATSGIELVGVLDQPPADSDLASRIDSNAAISDVMSLNPAMWSTILEPIMTRLSIRVRWWQLGTDRDTSFVGYPNLPAKIDDIRKQLYRFGQSANLGIAWKWIEEASLDQNAPWEFLQFSADPALTGDELAAYLEATGDARAARWALIEPLSAEQFSLEVRASDLVAQMLAAKTRDADAAFITTPFRSDNGVMHRDGTPDELFLPWRTTAQLIGGATFLGRIELPSGADNRVFRHEDGTVVLVTWNDQPAQDVLYLGKNVRRIDIWGRQADVLSDKSDEKLQVLDIDVVPSFFVGLNEPVVQWRMATQLERDRIPSVFGKPHPNSLHVTNQFGQGVSGTATISAGNEWRISPEVIRFRVASGESRRLPFDAMLLDASSGLQNIRIDFDLNAGQSHQFSVYRSIQVGAGDFEIEASTHLDKDGMLVIEQRMTNRTGKPADFRCFLDAPGHRRQRKYVFRLGSVQDVQEYRIQGGEALSGQELTLRAEELGGEHILIRRIRAQEF